ncbi:MAG: AMP-binding protein, partial [Planctomycetes bacterium]|nr:AMP-binding protein [Planctomycetota bacterium]
LDGIGSAESFHIYISNYPKDVRFGSLGKIVPGYSASVCDDEGKPLADGEIGTLHVSGDSAALMYWSDYAKSTETLRGGTIVSGDKFRRDEEGYYYYVGRADDLLKLGGIFVSPLEVEDCLMTHDAVEEVCVIGVEDSEGLAMSRALVVLAGGFEPSVQLESELQEYVKEHLAKYKYPRVVTFMGEKLPRNDRDKIDRKTLKSQFGTI